MSKKILGAIAAAAAALALVPGIALASGGGSGLPFGGGGSSGGGVAGGGPSGGGVIAGPGATGGGPVLGTMQAQRGGGVHSRNFCGRYWKGVRPHGGVGYNVYNDDGAGDWTCLNNNGNAGFFIMKSITHDQWGSFPNISEGWEWGIYARHQPRFPVKLRYAGQPVTSIYTRQTWRGAYNTAYDIWFSTYAQKTGQNNGAEVMIWLNHPGVSLWSGAIIARVRIEGVWFDLMAWRAFHNNTHWNYMAFVAVTPRTYFRNLWLNPFFRYAESIGRLSRNWYLTSIDAGFELVSGGAGLAINDYSLAGVR